MREERERKEREERKRNEQIDTIVCKLRSYVGINEQNSMDNLLTRICINRRNGDFFSGIRKEELGEDFFNKLNIDLFWDFNEMSKVLNKEFNGHPLNSDVKLFNKLTKDIEEKYGEWATDIKKPQNPNILFTKRKYSLQTVDHKYDVLRKIYHEIMKEYDMLKIINTPILEIFIVNQNYFYDPNSTEQNQKNLYISI